MTIRTTDCCRLSHGDRRKISSASRRRRSARARLILWRNGDFRNGRRANKTAGGGPRILRFRRNATR